MTIKRLARICTLFISVLLASFCTSQSSYSTSFINGVLVGDATPGCLAASGTRSCWLPISTAPPITQISSAGDQTFGLDAGGTVWNLPLQSHTWQSMAYSPMAQIVALPGGNLYGLQLDATFCAAPEMRAFQYTAGATDFVKLGFCAVNIGAAPDGTLYRIRSSGNVSHLVNGTWISDPSAGGNGTPVKIVAGSVRNVWILTSTGVLKVLDYAGTNTFVVTAGIVSDITTSGDPLENTAETYVVGTSIVTNDVYKYSSNTNALNGTWTLLKGVEALNKISSGNHYTLVGLSTSTHSVYHFQPMRLTMTAGVTGNYNCHVFPNGQCPQGAYHTATVNAHFNVGGNSSSGTASGLPQTTLSAYAYPFTDDCDPIMGVFEFSSPGPACRITASSGVIMQRDGIHILYCYQRQYTRITLKLLVRWLQELLQWQGITALRAGYLVLRIVLGTLCQTAPQEAHRPLGYLPPKPTVRLRLPRGGRLQVAFTPALGSRGCVRAYPEGH
jgi:hypothetical protein